MLDGDVDRVIELFGGDLTNTFQFIRVAEAMLELGRDDDATPGEDWPAEQAAAREVLAARDRGALVDVLLADGDTDEAWQVATSDPEWDPGEHRWARLAEAREPTDPAAAMGVYLRLVESTLTKADTRAYRTATGDLKRARRAAGAADLSEGFDDYLTALREHHRRRPTLIAMLDKAGLRQRSESRSGTPIPMALPFRTAAGRRVCSKFGRERGSPGHRGCSR